MNILYHTHARGTYSVLNGRSVLDRLSEYVSAYDRCVLLVDATVHKECPDLMTELTEVAEEVSDIIQYHVVADEQHKNITQVETLCRSLATDGCDRRSCLVPVGGGITGDIGGFVASIYMRGIPYIHVPTTLLAQVDSSLGGKTGVNIPEGKNLVGSVYHPSAVISDTRWLDQLSERQVRNGLAEVIKYGVIDDSSIIDHVSHWQTDGFEEIVEASAAAKLRIVEGDEEEHGKREVLNFGHTIGHAVEVVSDFLIQHGEAVAIGMCYEAQLAEELNNAADGFAHEVRSAAADAGLPTRYDGDPEELCAVMRRDKKNKHDRIHMVLPTDLGTVTPDAGRWSVPVDEKSIRSVLTS